MSSPPGDGAASAEKPQHVFKIGSYVMGETLGKGSFGKVKLATHEVTGHQVAVKILNRQKIESSQMDKKIRREIAVLKLFRHPHIIRLYDVLETATDIFMIMEFVNRGELFDYIVQKGKLSEDAARRFFQQIVSGVDYCHFYNVAHRDLKPENLLLDNDLNVKIADFGLSNLMTDGDFLKTSCGSPNYAAPEVISGMLYAGPEVDVWSCGVILYALLCGRLPFDEDSIPSLFQKIKAGRYHLPSSLPPGPRDIIKRVLVVDPMKRMTLAEVRQTEWFQTNLPPYLQVTPAQLVEQHSQEIDEKAVEQVAAKLEIDVATVRAALAGEQSEQQSNIELAYNILLDAKRRKDLAGTPAAAAAADGQPAAQQQPAAAVGQPAGPGDGTPASDGENNLSAGSLPQSLLKSSPVIDMMMQMPAKHTKSKYNRSTFVVPSSVPSYASGSLARSPVSCSPPFKSFIRHAHGLGGNIAASAPGMRTLVTSPTSMGPASMQGEGIVFPMDDGITGMAPTPGLETMRSDSLGDDDSLPGYLAHQGSGWRLGLMSEKRSADLMDAMYGVLEEKDLVWKVISPFHLSVRHVSYKAGGVKIGVRLYRMHDRHDKGFLIDLTRIDGCALPAMDLISELHDCFLARVA